MEIVGALVEILLSTFNGKKYLDAQLNSIIQQDYTNWKLLVRDDGSTDGTLAILNKYAQEYPGKIILLNDENGNIGYSNSFTKLLQHSEAEYVMYCDQDDYWYPFKISTMLSVMLEEEARLPAKAHIVFSDLQLAGSDLQITHPSFLKKMRYSARKGRQVFFLKNYVPGCNILFNRTLIQAALKTDNIINIHDHWLLMVCSSVGEHTCINKPLMKYRVHRDNAIGYLERNHTVLEFLKDIFKYGFFNNKYRNLLYSKNIEQAQNICERLKSNVSEDAISFSRINRSNYFSRKINNIRKPYIIESSFLKQLTYITCF